MNAAAKVAGDDNAGLPFADSEDLAGDIAPSQAPIQQTLVNTIPLTGTAFIAPYVPVNPHVALCALRFAAVSVSDTLVDLGCGDGRILIQALTDPAFETPPSRCIGVELDPYLCTHIRELQLRSEILASKLTVVEQNMFEVDLEALGATVLILYLLPDGLEKLKPMLEKWLKLGSPRRIVTIVYSIRGWEPVAGMPATSVASPQSSTLGRKEHMGGSSGVVHWLFKYE